MARRHEEHEEHIDESWLIPYADLLTLLLALFIVLFASSNVDKSKATAMAEAFQKETGVMPAGTNKINLIDEMAIPPLITRPGTGANTGTGTGSSEAKQIENLASDFKTYIATQEITGMTVDVKDSGLVVTLTSDIWFEPGSAVVNEPQRQVATEVAKMISEAGQNHSAFEVVVSGHTDNRPINNARYSSNMRLSIDRAVNFMEVLVRASGLSPESFSVRGFGENKPIDTNDTPEGRQRNRRVEVFITVQ